LKEMIRDDEPKEHSPDFKGKVAREAMPTSSNIRLTGQWAIYSVTKLNFVALDPQRTWWRYCLQSIDWLDGSWARFQDVPPLFGNEVCMSMANILLDYESLLGDLFDYERMFRC
jgi:hypothetical protein